MTDAATAQNETCMDALIANERLREDMAEARVIINALIGAMPPAVQRRWPNIIGRARRLTTAST